MKKKITKKKNLLIVVLAFLVATGANSFNNIAFSQQKKNKKTEKASKSELPAVINQDTTNPTAVADTIVLLPDREIEFDLEKLSRMASMSAYGSRENRASGLVVLAITVDEDGVIERISVKDSDNKVLNQPAMNAIRNYMKRYKVQAAVRNGKPARTEAMLVPVLFDMDLFK